MKEQEPEETQSEEVKDAVELHQLCHGGITRGTGETTGEVPGQAREGMTGGVTEVIALNFWSHKSFLCLNILNYRQPLLHVPIQTEEPRGPEMPDAPELHQLWHGEKTGQSGEAVIALQGLDTTTHDIPTVSDVFLPSRRPPQESANSIVPHKEGDQRSRPFGYTGDQIVVQTAFVVCQDEHVLRLC